MKMEEIMQLDDDTLFKLSLQRGGKHNCYTRDALKAQEEYCRRKGNSLNRASSCPVSKKDMSAYGRY